MRVSYNASDYTKIYSVVSPVSCFPCGDLFYKEVALSSKNTNKYFKLPRTDTSCFDRKLNSNM